MPPGVRDGLLQKNVALYRICNGFHGAEEDELFGTGMKEVVEDRFREAQVDIEILLLACRIGCVVGFPGQVDDRVGGGQLVQFIPPEVVLWRIFSWAGDIETKQTEIPGKGIVKV